MDEKCDHNINDIHLNLITGLDKRLSVVEKTLESKVSWIVFWSIVSLLVVIVGGMWAILYNEVKNVQQTSTTTRETVIRIDATLNGASIER